MNLFDQAVERQKQYNQQYSGQMDGWLSDRWRDVKNIGKKIEDEVRHVGSTLEDEARRVGRQVDDAIMQPAKDTIKAYLPQMAGQLAAMIPGVGPYLAPIVTSIASGSTVGTAATLIQQSGLGPQIMPALDQFLDNTMIGDAAGYISALKANVQKLGVNITGTFQPVGDAAKAIANAVGISISEMENAIKGYETKIRQTGDPSGILRNALQKAKTELGQLMNQKDVLISKSKAVAEVDTLINGSYINNVPKELEQIISSALTDLASQGLPPSRIVEEFMNSSTYKNLSKKITADAIYKYLISKGIDKIAARNAANAAAIIATNEAAKATITIKPAMLLSLLPFLFMAIRG